MTAGNDAGPPPAATDGGAGYAGALVGELGQLDRAVYAAIADTPTPLLDEPMRRLSNAANFSKLWIGIAAGVALGGGRGGRRAAATGLVAIGVTSAVVNQAVKRFADRARPDRTGEDVPEERYVHMPESTSFPSGHSASAFAFANAVGAQIPLLSGPLHFLAGAVAYSRVHTGVHYPGDVIIGSLIGSVMGDLVVSAEARWLQHRRQTGA